MDGDAKTRIARLASELGFTAVRFGTVGPTPRIEAYDRWLARGCHGEMGWMERNRDVRGDPRVRLPEARTAVVLATEHHHRRPPDPGGRTGMVARYAWGRDYHNLVGKRLKKLRARLRDEGVASWGGVDTAPILERSWAGATGLGFTGKNTLAIWPGRTSWMFLAVLFVDVPVEPDAPLGDHCGTCRRCLDVCPTDAFSGARDLDATRCIAYWTIEARGLPPRELRAGFGRWFFGCDRCQEVCPHNHGPPEPAEDDLLPRNAWIDLDEILRSPDAALIERFTGTPLRRPGAVGLKRNAALCLGNLGDDGAVDTLRQHGLTHAEPVVRAASVWALDALGDEGARSLSDPDPAVEAEIGAIRS